MKTLITILLLCFTFNAYAAKPTDPPTEPEVTPVAFVGYTTGVLTVHPQNALLVGTDMCKAEFGTTASIATSKEMRVALDDGTYTLPTTLGWFLPSDVIVTYLNTAPRFYDPHVQLQVVGYNWYLYANSDITRAPFSGTSTFPNTLGALQVACKN